MDDMRDMVRDPELRGKFEKLLRLAAKRGDADQVAERLSWGIDPNCASKKGTTALIANVRSGSPNAATVKALLKGGADPALTDIAGLTALDYARRKLMKIQSKPRRPQRKSPSLDENDQLQLSKFEQVELDRVRKQLGPKDGREFVRLYWQERLRAAKRKFNDPDEIEQIVRMLEGAAGA